MSKKELTTQKNERESLQALQFTLKRQDDQSKALQQVIGAVVNVGNEMFDLRDEVKQDIKEMRDDTHVTRRESSKIRSAVKTKSNILTFRLFGKKVSDELFLKKSGHMTAGIYTQIKEQFNVSSYLDVRHVDFENVISFVRRLTLEDFAAYQLRITDKQQEVADKHGDDISELKQEA